MSSVNANGFSAHAKTLVGKEGNEISPWMSKVSHLNPNMAVAQHFN